MQRWNGLSQVPADLGVGVVTLGNFDGVHRGHRAVLGDVVARARRREAMSIAVTFEPHPVAVLFPDRAPESICSLDHRLSLMEDAGVDAVLVMDFTHELAQWSPEKFVHDVFVDALHAAEIVVGGDTRFGVRNSGDVSTLRELGERYDFEVVVVDDQGDAAHDDRWSSSSVRTHLRDGDVEAAAGVLGRPHRVSGRVVHGDHRGRELGYPTANLEQDSDGLVPADGVYAGWLLRPGLPSSDPDSALPAAISVGTNPTFDGEERRVEAYVLDRTDLDLYGQDICVEFVAHLRPTLRFDSVDELLVQMAQDVETSRTVLSTIVPTRRG